ncbi:glycosyltransferase [Arundinibacter roseus]|uniref:Glycosyltransferase n=1 Tax=Arundinibacter roseus TaxID=2070510 RepID=A0A4R4K7Y5_9BACT|nr:glycosyltransferase [Arundinibacter roseus]TDB63473.1 glycosyltransferase [Arundinibacter roseus]
MVSIATKTTIACLPVAGPQNPYQRLMIEGLNHEERLHAFSGIHDKFWGIGRTVLKHRPDYLHFDWIISYYFRRFSILTYLSVFTFCAQIFLTRLLGVKIVWTLHNIVPHDMTHQLAVHRFCQRFLARRCEWIRVFATSTIAEAAEELRISDTRFRVVPEGDYTAVYPDTITQEQARTYLNLPAQARIMLYLGLIKPYKGVLELVRHMKKLDTPNTFLLIAGKGMDSTYVEEIRNELIPSIMLVDRFIETDELQYFFQAADVVVLPFKKIENSGSVIMAMGFAKPIIAPAAGAVTERLAGQSQWLFSSADELPEKITGLINATDQELKTIGKRNFGVLSNHRWEHFALLFS